MWHLYLEDGTVNPMLYDRGIIIYGCGNDGKKLLYKLKEKGITPDYFCDSNPKLAGTYIEGIQVLYRDDLETYTDYNLALAFYRWGEVVDGIPEAMKEHLFADYMYGLPGERECILCGHKECTYDRAHFAPFLQKRMFEGKERPTRLIHCSCCGLHYSDYRPSETEMQRLYEGYRNQSYVEQRLKYEPDYSDEIYNESSYVVRRRQDASDFLEGTIDFDMIHNVLDYGGDSGQYIPKEFDGAKKYVYDISGSETVSGVIGITTLTEVWEHEWDFVMSEHLLEHVSYPREIIENMLRTIRKGGYLMLVVPYQRSYYTYSDYEINEHINFFESETMRTIALTYGLHLLKEAILRGTIYALYQK